MSDEEDYYSEGDFEQEEGGEYGSPKKSPGKKPSTPKPTFAMQDDDDDDLDDAIRQHQQDDDDEDEQNGDEDQEEDGEDQKAVEGLDLEHYMMGMKMVEDAGTDNANINPAELQPLVGLQPEEHDSHQKKLRERLGYQDSERSFGDHSEDSPRQQHKAGKKKSSASKSKSVSSGGDRGNNGPSLQEQVEDQSAKVDALLMELFPEKYSKVKKSCGGGAGPKGKKASSSSAPVAAGGIASYSKGSYGMGVVQSKAAAQQNARNHYDDDDDEEEHGGRGGGDVLSTLDSQLKLLKKELKQKDEKISRLSEHSSMMANQLDRYKGECARLNSKLHDAHMELEAKEHRLQEALKQKKKAAKKLAQQPQSPSHDKSAAGLESEVHRLREREMALMEAIEELTSQNEDLIMKLRESMQRELELR